jgi:hypothetical protein
MMAGSLVFVQHSQARGPARAVLPFAGLHADEVRALASWMTWNAQW